MYYILVLLNYFLNKIPAHVQLVHTSQLYFKVLHPTLSIPFAFGPCIKSAQLFSLEFFKNMMLST